MMRELVYKAIKMRAHLLRTGKGKNTSLKLVSAYEKFRKYMEAYPKASDESVKKFVTQNYNDLMDLIPSNAAGNSIRQKVTSNLN